MTQKILQINFKFTEPTAAEHLKLVAPFADAIAAVPGLTWKVWIINDKACGMGIREDDDRITRNTSRFIPHCMVS